MEVASALGNSTLNLRLVVPLFRGIAEGAVCFAESSQARLEVRAPCHTCAFIVMMVEIDPRTAFAADCGISVACLVVEPSLT